MYFNFHTHIPNPNSIFNVIFNSYPHINIPPNTSISIGIHPWYIDKITNIDTIFKALEQAIQAPNCVAIGEAGLDKQIKIPLEQQIIIFREQLIVAQQYHKPIIVHCVNAHSEIIQLYKQTKCTIPLILHGFNKKWAVAKQCLDAHFYLSFGSSILYNKSTQDTFVQIPLTHCFLETDDKDISIELIYKQAASLKNISLEDLQDAIYKNMELVNVLIS